MKLNTPRWALPFLNPSRYKGAHGGRGSGKSHFFAELLIEHFVMNPSHRAVCIREVQQTLNQSVKRLLEDKIQEMRVQHLFRPMESEIRTKAGGHIGFMGMQDRTSENIKSLEAIDIAWVEEAQTLSQRSLDLLRPTIRKELSEIWFTWNPRFKTDPVDAMLRGETPPPGSIVKEINYMDNPWFPSVLKDEMEYDRGRDIDLFEHIWLGGYLTSSEARIFRNWTIQPFDYNELMNHDKPEINLESCFRFGADWGFAKDPTVLVRCFTIEKEGKKRLYIDHEAYKIGCEIDDTPKLFKTVPLCEKFPIVADNARPEIISYMRNKGFYMVASRKGQNSVEEGIRFLKSYDIVVNPTCKHAIDELMNYSYKEDRQTGDILPIPRDKHNHVIDALRYACEGIRRVKTAKKYDDDVALPSVAHWNK